MHGKINENLTYYLKFYKTLGEKKLVKKVVKCTICFYCIWFWPNGLLVEPRTPPTIWWLPGVLQQQLGGRQLFSLST
jgi:hypothetical protein